MMRLQFYSVKYFLIAIIPWRVKKFGLKIIRIHKDRVSKNS